MFLRKWLKQMAKFIRGGPGPLPTFLSCLIGFLLGMNPSFNLTWVLGLLALIVLNTNIGMAILCMILGRLTAFALAPVTFEIGYFVIHSMGLEGLFTTAGDTPVLALMDLHYYCVAGGIVVGLPIGAVLGIVMARLLQAIRKAIAAMVAGDKAQKLLSKKYVRFFVWLLIGGSKKTVAETLTARQPLLRKSGLIVCGVLVVVLVGGPMLLSGSMLANAIARQLTQANGAEVDIASAELSLAGGQFGLSGLQVTDRSKPTHNLAQVATLSADLSVTRLLAKQIVVDEMTLTLLETGVARSSPGEVLDPPPPEPEETSEDQAEKMGRVFTEYFSDKENIKKTLARLKKLRDYLAKRQERSQAEADKRAEAARRDARARGYFALSAADVLPRRPKLLIRRLNIQNIRLAGDPKTYRLEVLNLSSEPELCPEAMVIRFGDLSGQGEQQQFALQRRVFVECGFGKPAPAHKIDVEMKDLPMPALSDKVPVQVSQGTVQFKAAGQIVGEEIDLPLVIQVKDIKADPKGKSVLGLPPQTSGQIFQGLSTFTLVGGLRGPVDRPRLIVDQKQTLEALKGSLAGAAKAELTRQIDQRLEKVIGDKLPGVDKLPLPVPVPLPGTGSGGLGDLLGPKKDKKDADAKDDKKDQKKDSKPSLIPDFLK